MSKEKVVQDYLDVLTFDGADISDDQAAQEEMVAMLEELDYN